MKYFFIIMIFVVFYSCKKDNVEKKEHKSLVHSNMDTLPPSVSIRGLEEKETIWLNKEIRFYYTNGDDVSKVYIGLNDKLIDSVAGRPNHYSLNSTAYVDGNYRLKVFVVDTTGNKSPVEEVGFRIQNTLLTIEVSSNFSSVDSAKWFVVVENGEHTKHIELKKGLSHPFKRERNFSPTRFNYHILGVKLNSNRFYIRSYYGILGGEYHVFTNEIPYILDFMCVKKNIYIDYKGVNKGYNYVIKAADDLDGAEYTEYLNSISKYYVPDRETKKLYTFLHGDASLFYIIDYIRGQYVMMRETQKDNVALQKVPAYFEGDLFDKVQVAGYESGDFNSQPIYIFKNGIKNRSYKSYHVYVPNTLSFLKYYTGYSLKKMVGSGIEYYNYKEYGATISKKFEKINATVDCQVNNDSLLLRSTGDYDFIRCELGDVNNNKLEAFLNKAKAIGFPVLPTELRSLIGNPRLSTEKIGYGRFYAIDNSLVRNYDDFIKWEIKGGLPFESRVEKEYLKIYNTEAGSMIY